MVKNIDEKGISKHKSVRELYLPSANDMKDNLKIKPLLKNYAD